MTGRGFRRRGVGRAEASVLGVVLLLGVTIAGASGVMLYGSEAFESSIQDAEVSNVENKMSHLSSKSSLVALGDSSSQQFTLGRMSEGSTTVDESAGEITLVHEESGKTNPIGTWQLGAVVYTNGENEVAYQGGGVWRKRGDSSWMASPPEYHYRGSTLTFPIVRITGSGSTAGQTNGEIRQIESGTPVEDFPSNPLTSGKIVVKIQSDYCQGWYNFLSQRAEGTTYECDASNTVVSELTVPQEVVFDDAASLVDDDGYSANGASQNKVDESQIAVGKNYPSADSTIASKISDVKDKNDNDDTPNCDLSESGIDGAEKCELTTGTYYVDDDLSLSENLLFDTSDGNVTFVVDGNFHAGENEVRVTDASDNGVTYYVNGSFDMQGKGYVGTDSEAIEAKRNFFYVADGVFEESKGQGTPVLEAVVYAPDADIVAHGNPSVRGALVANTLHLGGNAELEYDTSLEGVEIEVTGAETTITYLHVTENVVEVSFD
jgi:hypothetical protein